MHKHLRFSALVTCCVALFAFSMAKVYAQGVTTSALTGTVYDASDYLKQFDEVLTGAKSESDIKFRYIAGSRVKVIHVASGTIYNALVRPDGFYNIRGLKPGGPYEITVSMFGYKNEVKKNVTFSLGENKRIDFALVENEITLQAIEVVSKKNRQFDASRNGAAMEITTEQLNRVPTVGRSLQDIARVSPYVVGNNLGAGDNIGALTIAGQNNRYNNMQVDGANINDLFGLSNTGTPGGQAGAQPISLDAIGELQVSVSPFDVRQSGFTGGLVNAVTRSGGNEFEGSVYTFLRNQSLVGLSPDERKTKFDTFSDTWVGGRLGGAIVKDKLFFFVNIEAKTKSQPIELGINDPSVANNFPVSRATIDQVINIARIRYGYDPGNYDSFNQGTNDVKFFTRFDWNINENHRLTFRHNLVNAQQDRAVDRNPNVLALSNRAYKFKSTQNNAVLQLNSTFENATNEFRLTYVGVRETRGDFAGGVFPNVEVGVGPNQTITMGVEPFSHANKLDQDIFTLTNDFTIFSGGHSITIGTHNEFYSSANVFFPWYFGNYLFGSVQDFASGNPFGYINRFSTNKSQYGNTPTAEFSSMQLGVYVQDDWDVSKNLRLNLGVRTDFFVLPTKPLANSLASQLYPGFATDQVPAVTPIFSPRVGFNWDISNGERTMQLRGGTGLFTGRSPIVWLSNQYSNTGVDNATNFIFGGPALPRNLTRLDPNNPPAQPAGNLQPGQYQATLNFIDKDWKLPQVWRTNLALDQVLPYGLSGTVEGIYSKLINQPIYQNLRLGSSTVNPIDGRIVYNRDGGALIGNSPALRNSINDAFYLTNTNLGYQFSLVTMIEKRAGEQGEANAGTFWKNLGFRVSYTYSESWDANSNPGFIADENFLVPSANLNNVPLARSVFDTPHRLVFAANYRFEYAEGDNGAFATTLSLLYEGRSGRTFSYVYGLGTRNFQQFDPNNSFGAFGIAVNDDAFFVPNNRNQVVMSDADWNAMNRFIDADPVLSQYRGQVVPRSAGREPWINQLDFRVAQEIPSFVKGHRFLITLDVLNVLNLVNSDWGHQQTVPAVVGDFSGQTRVPVGQFFGYDAQGRANMTFSAPQQFYVKDNFLSRWQMQLGLRYSF